MDEPTGLLPCVMCLSLTTVYREALSLAAKLMGPPLPEH